MKRLWDKFSGYRKCYHETYRAGWEVVGYLQGTIPQFSVIRQGWGISDQVWESRDDARAFIDERIRRRDG